MIYLWLAYLAALLHGLVLSIILKKIYAAWAYVKNLEESKDFYERRLSLKLKFQDENWIESVNKI